MSKPKKDSLDLFQTVVPVDKKSRSSLFMDKLENSKMTEEEKLSLSPVDFLCEHYEIVKEVADFLNANYGDRMSASNREDIMVSAYNDIVNILTKNKLLPKKDLVSGYVEIIFADIFGLGVLEPLLDDEEVDEIMVNAHDKIFVERHGKIQKTPFRFPSVDNAKGIVTKIITPLNKRLDASTPNVNAQLPDGSRLSASIPPLRANGEISITIRKFKEEVEPLAYYVQKYKSQTIEMATFLENVVKAKMSMIVSGGTGSGKTTLLNSLSMAIPNDERILTVEDTLELKLQQDHVEAYQTIEANMEGKGAFTTQQVIIEALRKRPDRIVVGECRGPEIVEMLNAMNTGHEGSLSTIHANNPTDMISRATTMIRSNEATSTLSEMTIYQMLNSALTLIVQTSRLQDGSRRVMNIAEVVGVGVDGVKRLQAKGILGANAKAEEKLYLQDIFKFKQTGIDEHGKVHGQFIATGYVPYCLEEMNHKNLGFDESFFAKRVLMEV